MPASYRIRTLTIYDHHIGGDFMFLLIVGAIAGSVATISIMSLMVVAKRADQIMGH